MLTTPAEERERWDATDPTDRDQICSDPDDYGLDRIVAAIGDAAWVLDLGCGPGRLAIPVVAAVWPRHVIGVDVWATAIRIAKERAYTDGDGSALFKLGDGRTIPARDEFFDAAYSMLLFQHLPDDAVAGYLRELARVLVPGGRFVFQYVEGDQQAPFNVEHDEDDVREWCAAAGLVIENVEVDAVHPEWRWVTGSRP